MTNPKGVTSFEVVRRARRALGIRKIGHLGTLDPMATGLLPLCLLEATKLVPYPDARAQGLPGAGQVGGCDRHPGCHRDSGGPVRGDAGAGADLSGRGGLGGGSDPGPARSTPPCTARGSGPTAWPAGGRRWIWPPRTVTVYELTVDEVAIPEFTMTVRCSQGTYIRTLAQDLGDALGCGAHLAALRRLAVGAFRVEAALALAALSELGREELGQRIIPLSECLPGMRPVEVGLAEARRLRQGQLLVRPAEDLQDGEQVRVLSDATLVAVAQVRTLTPQMVLAPVRVFGISEQ